MDQAAPSDQAVLWDLGKRGQDPVRIVVSVYVLVVIVKKRLRLDASLTD